ncbi:TetR/AcrR family transcriptional regulator [Plantactinospora sp. B24E8]|uniref:TetR/AcrR family transcriptional regulator n=1 Tax=Plantactinospora sp. B24E8 TaxID=3153567 RepID=UPI00325E9272
MTTEYSGTGDPKRSMELLWGVPDRPRRGPKPKLTVARIVQAAIGIADADGLAGLSMRRVAEQLGVTAMSLYTYVPGKGELLDVMLDTVYGEDLTPDPPPADGGAADWRARLERLTRQNYERYRRHPWLLQVASSRPVLGPNLMARWNQELVAVEGLDLTDVEMDLVITLLADYVHGAVRGAVEAAQAEQRTGMTDEQWWSSYAPLLEQVFDAERFPVAARVGQTTGEEYQAATDPARSFEFGLQRVLDGIGVLIQTRVGSADRT